MKNDLKTIAGMTAAAVATFALSQFALAQNITESTSSTSAWLGSPAFQTGAGPTTDSGGTTQDNDSWGGNANGVNGFGALGEAFQVSPTVPWLRPKWSLQAQVQALALRLYDLGTNYTNFPGPAAGAPTITQLNGLGTGGADGVNMLQAGDQFTFPGTSGQTLVTLTFGGTDADVQLLTNHIYLLSLDPTANADNTWWVRGGTTVAAYNAGEGFNADGVKGMQDFEGKTTVRDFDTAVTLTTNVNLANNSANLLGRFYGPNDPTDVGWVDPTTGNSITNASEATNYSFVSAGVAGYSESLQITGQAGVYGSDSVELQFSTAQIAAFNTNSYVTS